MRRIAAVLSAVLLVALADPAHAGQESWYTYWALGWSSIDSGTDSDKRSITTDILGFSSPLGWSTIVGVVMNSAQEISGAGDDRVRLSYHMMGPSVMHFFGADPGEGLFLRMDVGLAGSVVRDSDENSSSNDKSWGVLVGGGYGLPISGETRILFNVTYVIRDIEGENVKTLGISVGGLW